MDLRDWRYLWLTIHWPLALVTLAGFVAAVVLHQRLHIVNTDLLG